MTREVQSFPCTSAYISNDATSWRKRDIVQWMLPHKASFKWNDSTKLTIDSSSDLYFVQCSIMKCPTFTYENTEPMMKELSIKVQMMYDLIV